MTTIRLIGQTSESVWQGDVDAWTALVVLAALSAEPETLVELAAAGVTKATGLARVAESAGVARSDVIAFGDMPNDVDMLRWAGHGVAMGNGHPDVLAVADEVTASNTDDGVALVLERWFNSQVRRDPASRLLTTCTDA